MNIYIYIQGACGSWNSWKFMEFDTHSWKIVNTPGNLKNYLNKEKTSWKSDKTTFISNHLYPNYVK